MAAVTAGVDRRRRRRRDPQRGPGRRPRHARDARGHGGARGRGARRARRAAHRRPLLRRHARLHGRPRRARGARTAARSPRSATATRSRSTSRTGAWTSSSTDDEIAAGSRRTSRRRRRTQRRAGEVRAAGVERLRGGVTRLRMARRTSRGVRGGSGWRRSSNVAQIRIGHAERRSPPRAQLCRPGDLTVIVRARGSPNPGDRRVTARETGASRDPPPPAPRQEPAQQLVEARRALEHRRVAGVLEHLDARVVADQALVALRVADRHEQVVAPPHDQHRDLDRRAAARGRSTRAAPSAPARSPACRSSARAPAPAAPTASPGSGRPTASPPAAAAAGARPAARSAARSGKPAASHAAPARATASARTCSVESPAADTSTSRSTRVSNDERQLGADEAAHRVADDRHATRRRARRTSRRRSSRSRGSRSARPASRRRRSPAGRAPGSGACSMNAAMLSRKTCQFELQPCRNSSGGPAAAGVEHVHAPPGQASLAARRRCTGRQSTSSQAASSPSA